MRERHIVHEGCSETSLVLVVLAEVDDGVGVGVGVRLFVVLRVVQVVEVDHGSLLVDVRPVRVGQLLEFVVRSVADLLIEIRV